MKKPLIGITAFTSREEGKLPACAVTQEYVDAVLLAGGIPFIIPVNDSELSMDSLFEKIDGLLLTGGPDLNPVLYGDKMHPAVKGIDQNRDDLDIRMAEYAINYKVPFLGICRGFQVVNVALNGTLYSHIADQLPGALAHRLYPGYPEDLLSHSVRVEEGSLLAEILGSQEIEVNSLHHQGVKDLSAQLKAVAWAPDGLIEAFEKPDHPFGLCVQWHPEILVKIPHFLQIFKSFVKAASL